MEVTLKNSSLVKPAAPTPCTDLCISDCDQEKSITHAPIVYIYRPSTTPSFSYPQASQILKKSLSQVLVHFYPLAGRLRMNNGNGHVSLQCNSAGVMFYEAESNAKIEDFKDFAPTKELSALIPSVDEGVALHEQPLVLVQLTQLSCGGISLGLAISHIMNDATSESHFISEWARISRGEPLENLPFLDRSILLGSSNMTKKKLDDQQKLCDSWNVPFLMGKQNDLEERSKETTLTMLHLSATEVQKLKGLANKSRPSNIIRPYSTYEAVTGHMWRCATMSRGHHPDQPTKLCIKVSVRERMQLPKWYFGNAFFKPLASSSAGDLVMKPIGYAASKIREAIEMVTKDYVTSILDEISKMSFDLNQYRNIYKVGSPHGSFLGNPNMEVTSWLRIPFQKKNFGWGNEIYMGPGCLNSDGKCYIMPGQAEVGSVSIAVRLQVSHMDNFIKLFYQDIVSEPVEDGVRGNQLHRTSKI